MGGGFVEHGTGRLGKQLPLTSGQRSVRTGCQWDRLPQAFPDDASVHRTFQRWTRLGVFSKIWAVLVEECSELGGVDFEWQSVDAAMGKLASAEMRSAPTPQIVQNQA